MIRRCALLLIFCAATLPAQSDRPAVSVVQVMHIVADLDQSLAFYHDQLGLALRGPSGEHKFTDNPAVANLYGVPGQQFRAAVLNIPGSTFGVELVQWGQARTPARIRATGPGIVTLVLRGAYSFSGPKPFYDPDGFPVEEQPFPTVGASLRISMKDAQESAAVYDRMLGLSLGFSQAAGQSSRELTFPTPGQGMLRLSVPNIDAVTESLKAAGCSVITTGGGPVTLPQGPRVIILRDPNNFYWQLMEMPQK